MHTCSGKCGGGNCEPWLRADLSGHKDLRVQCFDQQRDEEGVLILQPRNASNPQGVCAEEDFALQTRRELQQALG